MAMSPDQSGNLLMGSNYAYSAIGASAHHLPDARQHRP